MSEETVTPPTPASASARRALRWTLAVVALVVLGLVGWHYGVELPAERRAAAELAVKRAANARTIPDLKLDLVWIAPGEFRMGSPPQSLFVRWFYDMREKLTHKKNPEHQSVKRERPMTRVTLTTPFWLARTEVTQAQWTAIMGSNPSQTKGDDLPVEQVSWDDAMEFCRKLTERERAAGRLPTAHIYTLPTEAQWEYACRAGTTGANAGNLDVMAWYQANSGGKAHPVGTKQPNGWGLADMHGNVGEWCLDWYADYPGGEVMNPRGPPSGYSRVFRDVMRGSGAALVRSTIRAGGVPSSLGIIGFRVALVPVK